MTRWERFTIGAWDTFCVFALFWTGITIPLLLALAVLTWR